MKTKYRRDNLHISINFKVLTTNITLKITRIILASDLEHISSVCNANERKE